MIDNQNSDQSIISLFMAKRDQTVISMPHKVQIYFYTNDFFKWSKHHGVKLDKEKYWSYYRKVCL